MSPEAGKSPGLLRVSDEQRERTWERCGGFCECGCGRYIRRDGYGSLENRAELHHIENLGMGGRERAYEDWELIWLALVHHRLEESQGYPHKESWKEMLKGKMEV